MRNTPRTTGQLTALESAALAAVYTHRIVATGQLRVWLGHDHGDGRYLQWCLANLRARGLLANLGRRNRSEWLWHATPAGATTAEDAHLVVPRSWRLTQVKAKKGVGSDHTVATNDAATALRTRALAAGHECGPLDWSNEVPHHWGKTGTIGGRHSIIADAVLRTTATVASRDYGMPDERVERVQFIEMDRSTMGLSRLVDKMRAYADYRQNGTRHWRGVYGWDFPALLVVLDGLTPAGLDRRRADLIGTVQHRRLLETGKSTQPWMTAAVATLDELRDGTAPTLIGDPHPNRRAW